MKKAFFGLLTTTVFMLGCNKSVDDYIDEAVDEFIFEGFYESSFDLQIEIDNGTATVVGFGDYPHDLSKDPNVFKIGDPYIKNIHKTGEDEWEGDVIKTNYDLINQKLTIKGYEKTKITVNSFRDGIRLDNPNEYESTFKKISTPGNGGGNGGGGNGGGGSGGGSATDTVVKKKIEGKERQQMTVSYTPPAGTKSMTIRTMEFSPYDRNYADMFVRKGTAPVIKHDPYYTWTADYAGIEPNRNDEVYTVANPSGTYYITLYGFNMDFTSWLVITLKK